MSRAFGLALALMFVPSCDDAPANNGDDGKKAENPKTEKVPADTPAPEKKNAPTAERAPAAPKGEALELAPGLTVTVPAGAKKLPKDKGHRFMVDASKTLLDLGADKHADCAAELQKTFDQTNGMKDDPLQAKLNAIETLEWRTVNERKSIYAQMVTRNPDEVKANAPGHPFRMYTFCAGDHMVLLAASEAKLPMTDAGAAALQSVVDSLQVAAN